MADNSDRPQAGSGKFNRLVARLAARKGVRNPRGLAATIGRRKYGAGPMAKAAAAGRHD